MLCAATEATSNSITMASRAPLKKRNRFISTESGATFHLLCLFDVIYRREIMVLDCGMCYLRQNC